jgi:flavin reductase (DIM6/NTAB) family NADH-FMN oxidoreductase RutF
MAAKDLKTRSSDFVSAGEIEWINLLESSADEIEIGVSQEKPNLAETIAKAKHFTINFLAKDNKNLSDEVESKLSTGDPEALGQFNTDNSDQGNPVFLEALAWYDYSLKCKPKKKGDFFVFQAKRSELH